jgi:hypothetical protein
MSANSSLIERKPPLDRTAMAWLRVTVLGVA